MNSEISFLESLIPSQNDFINVMLFMTLLIGFIAIVAVSKKYRYLFDYIEKFF